MSTFHEHQAQRSLDSTSPTSTSPTARIGERWSFGRGSCAAFGCRAAPALWRSALGVAMLGIVSTGCVTGPRNRDVVPQTTSSIRFTGGHIVASTSVQVRASSSSSGPFTTFATTTTSATPTLNIAAGGSTAGIYTWSVSAAVPAARWSTAIEADGCSVTRTYVRVDGGAQLTTFESVSEGGPDGLACFLNEAANGATLQAALSMCRSSDSPVLTLELESTHVGDVVIHSQADVDAIHCATRIQGSLEVAADAPDNVSLPRLRNVTGDVSLTRTTVGAAPHSAQRCGSTVTLASNTRAIELPMLNTVGGDLTMSFPSTGVGTTAGERIDLGLGALTKLGGSLRIDFDVPAVSPCGMANLGVILHDAEVRFANADVGGAFLGSLERVHGTLSVSGGFSVLNLFGALTRVGSLRVEGASQLAPSSFPKLARVDGEARFRDVGFFGPPLKALGAAGSLVLDAVSLGTLEAFGASSFTLSGLDIQNTTLSALTSGGTPLSKISLSATASLTILNNPNLGAAEICAFAEFELMSGWNGQSANLGGVSCQIP